MEFQEVVRARSMTRHFLPEAVDGALLDQLLSLALRSPSAGSTQGVELLVLTLESARASFWQAIGDPDWLVDGRRSRALVQAPVIVVPCASPNRYVERYAREDKHSSSLFRLPADAWPVPYWSVDAAFVAMTLLLLATDAGLGALFFHLQGREQRLLETFAMPAETVTIGAIAIGVPDPASGAPRPVSSRRDAHERVHREHW